MFKKQHVVLCFTLMVLLLGIMTAGPMYAQTETEEVSPNISSGTALFNTALAHRVVTDQLIVGDHDMGKLLENLINLMGRKTAMLGGGAMYSQAELQAVIDSSKLEKPIRLKQTAAPKEESKK